MKELVFVKHKRHSNETFLFEVSHGNVKSGHLLICKTMKGDCLGVAVTDSFKINENDMYNFATAVKAYTPLKTAYAIDMTMLLEIPDLLKNLEEELPF